MNFLSGIFGGITSNLKLLFLGIGLAAIGILSFIFYKRGKDLENVKQLLQSQIEQTMALKKARKEDAENRKFEKKVEKEIIQSHKNNIKKKEQIKQDLKKSEEKEVKITL